MQLTSFSFLLFAGGLLILYYLVPRKLQWPLLLIASTVFYLCGGVENVLYILFTGAVTYGATRIIEKNQEKFDKKTAKKKNRLWIILTACLIFGLLAVCKVRFTFENILLPLGLSFYMFQSVGYVLDVYRGTVKAEKNPLKLLMFISYFPQLVQGPISKFGQLGPQLFAPHKFDGKQVAFGLERMLWGFFKKMVIADRIAVAIITLKGPSYTGLSFLVLTIF